MPRWPTAQARTRWLARLSIQISSPAIDDSGLGIANTENLFVPFYTTKPKGSGVGLALAQQIARAHGGEIRLLNREEGPGARATIHLPFAVSVILQPAEIETTLGLISVATTQLRPLFFARYSAASAI